MGRYFNPPTEKAIEAAGGRPVQKTIAVRYTDLDSDHEGFVAQLRDGEALGLLVHRFDMGFKQMPDVTDPREFKEFVDQILSGILFPMGVYAMPREAFR